MNKEQVIGLSRHLLPFIGGMAVARGYITQEGWAVFSEQLLQVAGPTITLAGLVWSYMDKTDKAIVEKAIALPDVAKIECCDTPEGVELAESGPIRMSWQSMCLLPSSQPACRQSALFRHIRRGGSDSVQPL